MIYSMTGYGKSAAENGKFKAEVELKSVNSRYLEIGMKLPPSLAHKEYELKELIKNRLKRGKISVLIQLKRNGTEEDVFTLSKEKLKNYLTVIKNLKKAAKITEKVKLEHLLYNKDLFQLNETEFSESEFELIKDTLVKAISELILMKKNEGKELANDLRKRIVLISQKLDEIEVESGKGVQEYFGKLKEKVKLLAEDVNVDQDRLALELAIIADKAEITEECVRLRSHIKFFSESLEKDDEPGRKLNFLCQEMNRETNTISSKTISIEVTHNTVFIKEEIEKIREQLQNIE